MNDEMKALYAKAAEKSGRMSELFPLGKTIPNSPVTGITIAKVRKDTKYGRTFVQFASHPVDEVDCDKEYRVITKASQESVDALKEGDEITSILIPAVRKTDPEYGNYEKDKPYVFATL